MQRHRQRPDGDDFRQLPHAFAVVDSPANDRLYLFAEVDARAPGCTLRRFDDTDSPLNWLWGK